MQSNENWISEVERLLEHIYPNEWSLSEYPDTDYPYHYYIHFPLIEITNSRNLKHIIKDLYVRFQFRSNGELYEIDGTRATFNQAEFESGYAHSHLSSLVVSDAAWGGFCFGNESINNGSYDSFKYNIKCTVNYSFWCRDGTIWRCYNHTL